MTEQESLIIVNPNLSQSVTVGVYSDFNPLRLCGIPIRCLTLSGSRTGIENQKQADLAITPMLSPAEQQTDAARCVIAFFGDLGMHALRDGTLSPVFGIQEAAVITTLNLCQHFGDIFIMPKSIPRQLRSFGAMGDLDRLAGDPALGLGLADLADRDKNLNAMIAKGLQLRDEDGTNVLIMGSARMTHYNSILDDFTGLPLVEPYQAAVSLALGQIVLNLSHKSGNKIHAR